MYCILLQQQGPFTVKYTPDLVQLAHIRDVSSLLAYTEQVDKLIDQIREDSITLNIFKTKELCCGGNQTPNPNPSYHLFEPLRLNWEAVKQRSVLKNTVLCSMYCTYVQSSVCIVLSACISL